MKDRPHKKGLRTKIIFVLLIVGSFPVIVGLIITYWNGTFRLRELMGHNFQGLAREASRKTDLVLEREIEGKKHLSITTDIKQVIKESNQIYTGRSEQEIKERLAQMNNRWEGDEPTFKEGILLKETSIFLRNYMLTKGVDYPAFFVTDQKGAIVASTNGFPGFLHNQESWWKEAYNDGVGKIYIGDLYFNEKAQTWAINIAVPVMDEEKRKAIGVLAVFHDVRTLIQPSIHDIRFGETGHAMLIDSDGRVLTCPVMATGSFLTDKMLVTTVTSTTPGWVMAKDDGHGGHNSIIGFSPAVGSSEITLNSTGKRWHSFIRQDPRELYAPINTLLLSVSLSGIVLIGFVAVMGVFFSEKLTRPIKALHEGAEEIGKGNLDVKLNIKTNDEIELLANEFNRMAEKLKESYSTLEQKVNDRTRQLTALNIIATTTNRSLDLQEILENSLDKIIEVMDFQAGAIRFLEAEQGKLVLKVSRGLPPDFIQNYKEIAVNELISG
jgi:two-component system NtrC family sensor kinase